MRGFKMSEKQFERFGKYLILDHLVDGGMAKICRAKFLGEQANKIVAIKMVQPQFSKDPSFVQMFEDELKITFGLLHPNIVQMTDYGLIDGQLYSAMEYVDGANLKEFLDRLKEKNFVFPVGISTYIISQVCQALHYAHTFTDKLSGKPFNIIHRDISPHNIMLTYDGSVKVIDFGIAKADSNSEATQAGTIKGKLSYLAPEYLDGLELDPRYDLFAVGITLWELLCSRKLFTAANDLAVLKQIQACKVPRPSSINPNVPKELDEIVLKALAKDRNNRYENMDQFNRALVKFLYSHYPDFNATDLSYFAKQLFKEEIAEDKEKFVEYGKIDVGRFLDELQNDISVDHAKAAVKEAVKKEKIELDLDLNEDLDIPEVKLDLPPDPPSQKREKTATHTHHIKSTQETRTSISKVTSKPFKLNKVKSKESTHLSKIILVAGMMGIVYFKADMIKNITGFDIKATLGFESKTVKMKRDVAHIENKKSMGIVSLSNYDSSMKVQVNGKTMEITGIDIKVPLDQNLIIEISKTGFETYKHSNFSLDKENNYAQVIIPELKELALGSLFTSRNFSDGSKLIIQKGDQELELNLPLSGYSLPVGKYRGMVVNPFIGSEREVKFEIFENRKTELSFD